jgi:hypothetical protein
VSHFEGRAVVPENVVAHADLSAFGDRMPTDAPHTATLRLGVAAPIERPEPAPSCVAAALRTHLNGNLAGPP